MRFWRRRRGLIPETWADSDERHRTANGGWGMCNTGYGWNGICAFGGIGCNIDHLEVARRNRKSGVPIEDKRLMFAGFASFGETEAFAIPRPSSGKMVPVTCDGCGERLSDELYPAEDVAGMGHYHNRCAPV